ncbi:MAG: mycofactocin system FadH/OYE family oxidoreductase 1 [Ilumatobacteraceae bacterium]
MRLLSPLQLGSRTAPNRIMFGPHVTNLGNHDRSFSDRHVAYYQRRARGGCGLIVTEGASVHESDWPYERAPRADLCGPSWSSIVEACHAHDAIVIASLDHAGGQGSSAFHQSPLWAPSRVPEVITREVPKWMERDDIQAVIDGFCLATTIALDAGCDGVEINAGQHSLVRQFLSGLTNQRTDEWGMDKTLFARQVISAVRAAGSVSAVIGLRLSCDELAPWAGITPEIAAQLASQLVNEGIDYLVVVRGSIYSTEKTRPDFHEPPMFNRQLCSEIKSRVCIPVFLQGSVIDTQHAEEAIASNHCDAVEMTRAQIADAELVSKLRGQISSRIRPCILCNQTCQVRDVRNPLVTCVVDPRSGYESTDMDEEFPVATPRSVTVIGGGVAGLETARVAALCGHRVAVVERNDTIGGLVAVAGPGKEFVDWLTSECAQLGVTINSGTEWLASTSTDGESVNTDVVIQCTGSLPGIRGYDMQPTAKVFDVAEFRYGTIQLPEVGDIVIQDPIGGPIGIAVAEELGNRAILITPDNVAGNELSRTGDLAPANVRLARAGVRVIRRALLRLVTPTHVEVEDRFTGQISAVPCVAVIDCGFRLPTSTIVDAHMQVGDCVAPRTILEAVLEARRAANAIGNLLVHD